MDIKQLTILVTMVNIGSFLPVPLADPLFTNIARKVAPRVGSAFKSHTIALLRGLEPGGKQNSFWLSTSWYVNFDFIISKVFWS